MKAAPVYILIALAWSASGCGQKGPLVLPSQEHPHKKVKFPVLPKPSAPAPSSPSAPASAPPPGVSPTPGGAAGAPPGPPAPQN
ncbi:MAG TPA: lipoprotein [Steroidobacteraceae bacterium]|nr:lipoprotein [Steroidobacteraceae bacterium]